MTTPSRSADRALQDLELATNVAAMANALSSCFPAMDDVLAGGFPRGRLSVVAGPLELRSPLLRATTVAAQRSLSPSLLSVAAWVDGEHRFDVARAAAAGVVVSRLLVSQPDTAEQLFDVARVLARSGAVDLLVVTGDEAALGLAASQLATDARHGTAAVVLAVESLTPAMASAAAVVVELAGMPSSCAARVLRHAYRDDLGVAFVDLDEPSPEEA